MSDFGSLLGGGLEALLSGLVLKDNLGQIKDDRGRMLEQLYGSQSPDYGPGGLMGKIEDMGSFIPSTVTSRTGNTAYDPVTGRSTFNLSGAQQNQANMLMNQATNLYGQAGTMDPRYSSQYDQFSGAAQTAMQRSMMDPAAREQEVYDRIRATQRPEEQRQMEKMNSNLFGSGRGGMFSSAYGGTPEQMAFEKARGETMNQAMLSAMGQAQNEMMNQGQLAQSYGGMGMNALAGGTARQQALAGMGQMYQQGQYLPEQMLMQQQANALQQGQLANQAAQGQAGMMAQLGLGGMTTDVNWSNVYSGLLGEIAKAAGAAGGGLGEYLGGLLDTP